MCSIRQVIRLTTHRRTIQKILRKQYNVVMVTTDKPSRLVSLTLFGKKKLNYSEEILPIQDEERYQHLHFTDDSPISEGEDVYGSRFNDGDFILYQSLDGNIIFQKTKYNICKGNFQSHLCKKICVASDKSLGLPLIGEQFKKSYANNPTDTVWLEMEMYDVFNRSNKFIGTDFRLKLNKGEVIVVEDEKVYSREEVIDKIAKFSNDMSIDYKIFDNWIKENL